MTSVLSDRDRVARRSFAEREPQFEEAFRNRYATGFSARGLMMMAVHLVLGLTFSAVLLFSVGYFAFVVVYVAFGLDPIGLKDDISRELPSLGTLAGSVVAAIVWLCAFAYLGPHSLIRFKRRLSCRLHVLAGRPLASVEGRPTFERDSELGVAGIRIGDLYFEFDDCDLDVGDDDLKKLEQAGGTMRISYIPTGMRAWTNPATGKEVKYDCVLVRAERAA